MQTKNNGGWTAGIAVLAGLMAASPAALAGSFDLFGVTADYKLTLGYGLNVRAENPAQPLVDGPISQMQVEFSAIDFASSPSSLGLRKLDKTGLPFSANFDDGSRDFAKVGSVINNRASAYGETHIRLKQLGLGNVGIVASGAAHYDQVYFDDNEHDNKDSVNRAEQFCTSTDCPNNGVIVGPINKWTNDAEKIGGKRGRLLEAYIYGDWYLTDSIALNLRAGRHLAAWGESLFFPGIVSAQGPFDATKAFIPGAEVKEILLPVNQVSMQLALNRDLTLLAYKQFEFGETEIFPQGDYFSPADLVGPGSTFGYGSINPVHDQHCTSGTAELSVRNSDTGADAPPDALCDVGAQMTEKPEYIMTFRTPDDIPDPDGLWGVGVKYQLLSNLSVGAYHINYANHNPNVALNMGYAYVGKLQGQDITTENFGNLQVPTSYTIGYADRIKMDAVSFSTVVWVFNVAGEFIRRQNVDTSLEAVISGETVPWGTRGDSTTAQLSLLYVNNPDFLMYDEVIVVGEFGYTQIDRVDPQQNRNNVCFTGTDQSDCSESGSPHYQQSGSALFYDRASAATQFLVLPKGRNVFPGWDIGTPISFAWLFKGTPSTAGAFGALYGEGDMRASVGVTAQYLQNMEFALNYNAFLGDAAGLIRNSNLAINPYTDKDYLSFSVKYNL